MDIRPTHIETLDLLVDGASSFAALYSGLQRLYGHSDLGVVEALETLQEMESLHLVRSSQMTLSGAFRDVTEKDREKARRQYSEWLPSADPGEVSLDEIGIWYEITADGRRLWRESGPAEPDGHRWVLTDRVDEAILEIQAESSESADESLREWLATHDEIHLLPETKKTVWIPSFILRDGSKVRDGVLLTCRYHKKRNKGEKGDAAL